jgi:hypothetical protein
MLWKLIRDNQYVWPRSNKGQQSIADLSIGKLNMYWNQFAAVANDKADKSVLPDEVGFAKPFAK